MSRHTRTDRIADAFKYAASRITPSRRKKTLLRRVGNRNLAIGLTAGMAAGIATGMLMAPQKGKEIRHTIAKRTNEFGRHLGQKSSRLWMAGKESAEGAGEAIPESMERH